MNQINTQTIEKRNLRISEFTKIYGIGRTLTYKFIKEGSLKAFKCGKATLIAKTDAEAWCRSLQEKGGAK